MLLYDSRVSGNCYKVRLLLAHLGVDYERLEVDVVDRSNRLELLGGLNPALRVPTLVAAMERELLGREFLVAGRYTIADIALYAYTHVAGEGGFDLSGYPAIGAWLERVAGQPRHVSITA